jgi:hypothetical protein
LDRLASDEPIYWIGRTPQNDSTPPPLDFFVNWINRIALVSSLTKQWKKSVLCNNGSIGYVTPDLTADEDNQAQNRNQQLALI